MTAETIAKTLGGRRAGSGWVARCPTHDDRTPSLSIEDADSDKVLVHCHAGCDQGSVIAVLQARGLLHQKGLHPKRVAARTTATSQQGRDDSKRTEKALCVWRVSTPALDTLVESYLAARKLYLSPPPTLRFHTGLKHPAGGVWPAMVALVTRGYEDEEDFRELKVLLKSRDDPEAASVLRFVTEFEETVEPDPSLKRFHDWLRAKGNNPTAVLARWWLVEFEETHEDDSLDGAPLPTLH